MNLRPYSVFIFLVISAATIGQTVIPGHSHNDYLNKRPLFAALENGLISVEADVHLIKDELYVVHVRPLLRNKKRTLEALYLKPLFEHIEKNNGKVYSEYEGQFYLMIDFKNGSVEMYDKLIQLLRKYRTMLTTIENGEIKLGMVTVFMSGSRPTKEVLEAEPKLAFLDGRPNDIGNGFSADVMPVISDSYRSQLKWNGHGEMPADQRGKLKSLASRVHAEGKKLRLWASPDNPNAWKIFQELGVDLINTDRPKKFREFMLQRSE